MSHPMKTVIMAGGKGTRIQSVAADIPKPMIPVEGVPILERELLCLREQGFRDFIFTVGHLGQVIVDYFGDGSSRGVRIQYAFEHQPLGNAGALFRLRNQLTDDFLLLNGDTAFDIDFQRFVEFHHRCGGLATIFTHPNAHPYDSALITADGRGCVTGWLSKESLRPDTLCNRVNAGLHVLSPKVLDRSGIHSEQVGTLIDGKPFKVDLDRQLLQPLAGTGDLFCYDSPEYVKDMGTPERLKVVCDDIRSGLSEKRSLRRRLKAVFLDRDGTINRYAGFITRPEQISLLPGAAEAIRAINVSGYLAIVVSNQPVVARGEVTVEELEKIHGRLETLLGREGAYLDAITYCPHHPDKGFPGEVPELKVDCNCRKPKPGLLLQAAEKWNLDLSQCWMIGDSDRDVEAGHAAGCRVVRMQTDGDLLAAVRMALNYD